MIPTSVCTRLDHSTPQPEQQHSLYSNWGAHHPSKVSCLGNANLQIYSSDFGGYYLLKKLHYYFRWTSQETGIYIRAHFLLRVLWFQLSSFI